MISFGLGFKRSEEGGLFSVAGLYVGMIGASSIWLQNTPEQICAPSKVNRSGMKLDA